MALIHAILVVDVQVDFCPGGALPVSGGDEIVPVLNRYIEKFVAAGLPIFASRDWHPENTRHFERFGGSWPGHCIQGTRGAQFHPDLKLPLSVIVISAGMDIDSQGYSAFEGVDQNGKSLDYYIESMGIRELSVGGLATDYCVKWSVIEALQRGIRVNLLVDTIRGVEVKPGDSAAAIDQMLSSGAKAVTLNELTM